MFFILSKLLIFLLMPFWWIMLLLVWIYFTKKAVIKKRLWTTIILILVVFTNPFLYRSLVAAWQPNPVELPAGKTYEAGILLGGMSGYDKNDKGFFGDASDRFIEAANLYHRGIIKKIIITGGTGELLQQGPPESYFLRQQLLYNGVNDSAIIIESKSRNTYENGIFTKKITDSLKLTPPFVLITSAIHMRRSASVFKKVGFDFVIFPCDYKVYPRNPAFDNTILPDVGLLDKWSFLIKEMVGLCVYKLTGKA
jgi:uncharacterized SAM-binding protein YcdF (DUF218 family)